MADDAQGNDYRRWRLHQLDRLLKDVEELHGYGGQGLPRSLFVRLRAAGVPVRPTDTPTATLDRIFEVQERFMLRLPGEPRSDRREKPLSAARLNLRRLAS